MKVIFFEGSPDEFITVAPYLGGQLPGDPIPEVPGREEGPVGEEQAREKRKNAIRIALNRAALTENTKQLFQILHEGEIQYEELVERMEIGRRGMTGVTGSLGRRMSYTPEIEQAGLPGNIYAMVIYRLEKGSYYLSLTQEAAEVLEEEGYIE